MDNMTPAEFEAKMRDLFPAKGYDQERSHGMADKLLCEVLREMGYGAGVDVFESADKWYS